MNMPYNPVTGPSPSCVKYDDSRLLTQQDIESIVHKINDRRNFIALSLSKYLPGAANMRKVVWSHELAHFAQRWVDQCDPSTLPDKEDDCRNLEASEVGQNIATMSDLSPGFNVKSFVEMWYMQSIDYFGSVTFYNQVDNRTKYFTQLIWANTDVVGCGQIDNLHLTLRRLVCNFAPRGNILGKPVYIIGYPATQCPSHMVPDANYKGLCTNRNDGVSEKQVTQTSPVSSLLRIINLSDSPKLLNKQTLKRNESSQIAASAYINKTHAAVKRYPHNFWSKTINHSKPYGNYLHEEENHQRLNRVLGAYNNLHTINKNTEHIFNKHEAVTTPPMVLYSNTNNGKIKPPSSCTRKKNVLRGNCEDTNQETVKCTRDQTESRDQLSRLDSTPPSFMCPCDYSLKPTTTTTTTSTTTANWISTINCSCLNKNNLQMLCSNLRRHEEESFYADKHKSTTFYYYDLLPNLHVQEQMRRDNSHNKFSTYPLPKEDYSLNGSYRKKGIIQHYRNRQKRDGKQYTTTKPFWKMDESLVKRPVQPKAARYTTITNRKIKQTKRSTIVKSTESITVKVLPKASVTFQNKQSVITEKYLSFDELMQLRKLNIGGDHEARRKGADSTTTVSSTTIKITANTPFIRMKHCTRKLTCTWTVPKNTDCNGSVIVDSNGSNRGSRTPPGYVDGCTRTSTCTRDYMDRNRKASTEETVLEVSTSTTEADDDDYCERRSLKVKRRHSNQKIKTSNYNLTSLDLTTIIPINRIKDISVVQSQYSPKNNKDCVCYDFVNQERGKRNYIINSKGNLRYHKKHGKKRKKIYSEEMHYGELYYKILEKIKERWQKSKRRNRMGRCLCNGSFSYHYNTLLVFLLLCTRFTR